MFSPKLRTRVYLSQNENVFTVFFQITKKKNSVTYKTPNDTQKVQKKTSPETVLLRDENSKTFGKHVNTSLGMYNLK